MCFRSIFCCWVRSRRLCGSWSANRIGHWLVRWSYMSLQSILAGIFRPLHPAFGISIRSPGSCCFSSAPGSRWAAFWLAIAYIIFAFVVTMAIRVPDIGVLLPHWILQPFDPNDKTNLAPYRVVHFMALAVVVTRFLHLDSPILQWRALAPLIRCGQHSLQVFCTGIVLSFCAHAAIELSLNSLWIQIVVGATGISLMTVVAYGRTWSKQRDRVLSS